MKIFFTILMIIFCQCGFAQKADWQAKWIGMDKASPWDSMTTFSRLSARYLRKEFSATAAIKKATVYISGLGMYELFINGKQIGDQVLAPAPTDYRKSVLYNSFDVTHNIKSGANAVAVVLGNGRFFNMRQNYKPQKINTFGFPKLLFQLEIEYSNGKKKMIGSDESWKLNADGPIRSNNEYDGEEYNATKEFNNWSSAGFDDSKWAIAELVNAPLGKLTLQMNPQMKIMRTIQPVAIKKLSDKRFILDMGQNFSGWMKIKVEGVKGDKVKLRFAESLQSNGELYVANLRDAKVTDIYWLKDGVQEWHPSFVYHGFRYVEVNDYPGIPTIADFEGHFIYDEMLTTGSFSCSDTIINQLVKNAWWGIASNYKGMPVDCPQRNERQPWLGDRTTGSAGESYLFNNKALYLKGLDDIEQSQTAEGSIPDVAPAFWNYYSDNVTWPATYIMVADMLRNRFGDRSGIDKHYNSMKKWLSYMQQKYMKDYIITKDKYGDWCVPPESLELIRSKDSLRNTDGALLATAYYYHLLQKMISFNKSENDISDFKTLSQKIAEAFNKKYFDPTTNRYDNNTVTANLLPLYFGMAPKGTEQLVFKNIHQKLEDDNMHISTGVIGTQFLMRTLSAYGRGDLAYQLASNTTYPSWGYMVKQGATTIWELWNGNTANPQMNSQNHVMLLGDFLIWLFENAAGIKNDENAKNAFTNLVMKPEFDCGLSAVNASYNSVSGVIKSEWKRSGTTTEWTIELPAGTSATIFFPGSSGQDITESGKSVINADKIKLIEVKKGFAKIRISSGQYHFKSAIN